MIEWALFSLLSVGQVLSCDPSKSSNLVQPNEFKKVVDENICISLEEQYDDVHLTVLAVRGRKEYASNNLLLGDGHWSSSILKAGRISLRYSLPLKRDLVVWFKVQARKNIWVTKKNLPAGTRITSRVVSLKSVDVAPYANVKSLYWGSPVGKYLVGSHIKGRPFVDGELRAPPLAERNEEVKVLYKEKNFAIELGGVLLENAWVLGDLVKVRLVRGNKIIDGVVTGKSNVSAVF